MMKHLRISIAVLAAGFIASGCVSNGTFKKMEEGKKQEIATLQQEKASISKENSSLEQQNTELKQQVSSLDQQKASVQQQGWVAGAGEGRLARSQPAAAEAV